MEFPGRGWIQGDKVDKTYWATGHNNWLGHGNPLGDGANGNKGVNCTESSTPIDVGNDQADLRHYKASAHYTNCTGTYVAKNKGTTKCNVDGGGNGIITDKNGRSWSWPENRYRMGTCSKPAGPLNPTSTFFNVLDNVNHDINGGRNDPRTQPEVPSDTR